MMVVLCDLCGRRLEPRGKHDYGWVSKGGVIVIVDDGKTTRPARLVYEGRDVNECCTACAEKVYAKVWLR